jgi:hypothetical protein
MRRERSANRMRQGKYTVDNALRVKYERGSIENGCRLQNFGEN